MDESFKYNFIEQESELCRIPFVALKKILEFLTPKDVVRLSHTCKCIYVSLPFYLIQSGEFWFTVSCEVNFSRKWLEGPAINFFVNEINISLDFFTGSDFTVWIELIRNGNVVLKTQKLWSQDKRPSFHFSKESSILREYKPGDKLWFMVGLAYDSQVVCNLNCFGFEVSLRLESYKYDELIKSVARKGQEYGQFEKPFAFIEDPYKLSIPSGSRLHSDYVTGNNYFSIIKFIKFILDSRV